MIVVIRIRATSLSVRVVLPSTRSEREEYVCVSEKGNSVQELRTRFGCVHMLYEDTCACTHVYVWLLLHVSSYIIVKSYQFCIN